MMIITLSKSSVGCIAKSSFWLGEQEELDRHRSDDILEVQADGDELELIYRQFENLPKAKFRRVVVFTGDMANFIARNIDLDRSHS